MSQFRIAAKKLFLTYSQVNPEITAQEILYQLQNNPSLHEFRYVIAKELHKDGGVHFHVVLMQHEKVDIRNPKALDIQYQERNFHGNYAPIKNLRHAIAYVCKHQDYITNLDNLRDGQLLSAKQFIISQVKEKGIEQALLEHYDRDPEKAIAGISISALKKQFYDIQKLQGAAKQDNIQTIFGLEHFRIPEKLQLWYLDPTKTLLIVGNSGIGKTQFCKAVAQTKNLKTLLVNHKEDFRRLNDSYQCIIIDDANLHEFEETQLLSIIETQATKSIRVLYDNVSKKSNMVQMIAMNKKEFHAIHQTLKQPRFARRILIVQPEQPFMVNVNINIVNNVNNVHIENHNYNQDFNKHQEQEQLHIEETQRIIEQIIKQ